MNIFLYILMGILGTGTLLGCITLLKSKTLGEKAVSLDVLTTVTTIGLLTFALLFDAIFILDIVLVYAVLSFGALVVIARYYEGGM